MVELGVKRDLGYGEVVNMQLNRVARARSLLFSSKKNAGERFVNYLTSVEALRALLLPELRGDADRFIQLASTYYRAVRIIASLADKTGRTPAEEEKLAWARRAARAVESEIPGRVRVLMESAVSLFHKPAFILDLAVEEMIKRLREAGLIIYEQRQIDVGLLRGVEP